MRTRRLGRSAIELSEIGFGCGPTAGLMLTGTARERAAVVGAALEAGINYFDTAAHYGGGRSEANLGATLRELGATALVGTKVTLDLPDMERAADAVISSVEESLIRLRRDRIDVLYLHNRVGAARAARPDIGSGALLAVEDVLAPGGLADILAGLKRRGLVRAVGCCAYGGEPAAVAKLVASGMFEAILVHYSMINTTAWGGGASPGGPDYRGMGAAAAAEGMGCVALRVLEAGALVRPVHDAPGEAGAAGEDGRDAAETAIGFALANEEITSVLVGISELRHLHAAVSASRHSPRTGAGTVSA
jgi:aryl-alcohol dehydrogenase-like predicted oxidoreductase